jgi:hypothetical protein
MVTSTKPTTWAQINEQGDLVIPKDLIARYGLTPGATVRVEGVQTLSKYTVQSRIWPRCILNLPAAATCPAGRVSVTPGGSRREI